MIDCRHTILVTIAAYVLFPLGSGLAHALPPSDPPSLKGPIEYVGPDTYIVVDSQGRPQPVLGMSYDEFVTAWKKLQSAEAKDAVPRYVIERLDVSGQAIDDRLELRAEIVVRCAAAGVTKVPLGMAEAILQREPTWESLDPGATEETAGQGAVVSYETSSGGFTVRIRGQADQRHKLTLDMLVPIQHDGNDNSLRLNFPRALVSQLDTTIRTAVGDAAVSSGSVLKREFTRAGATRLIADGLTGDFRLTWSMAGAERPELATVLSATGALAISIDGHSIRTDAQLTVRSYGGSFDKFRVRLPPGAQLIQDQPQEVGGARPGYRVSIENASPIAGETAQIAVVELAEKQFGPVEIELSTEQPLGLPSAERAVEIAGFDVVGAVRQFGDVALRVADDWQLRWEGGPFLRQVESTDLKEVLRDPSPAVALQYDRQPWSLRVQLAPRPMVVHVAPDYVLDLDADEARLHAHLVYQVPGARAFAFRVQLRGWELTPAPIESSGLVDRDGVTVTRDGVLVLPLGQASSRRAEITLDLCRPLTRDASLLTIPLPILEADSVAHGELEVSAAPDVELLPDMARSRSLAQVPVMAESTTASHGAGREVFRFRTWSADAVFAARREIRATEVVAALDCQLTVDHDRLQLTQEIDYDVKYQPIRQLAFDVPVGWSIVDNQIELVLQNADAAPLPIASPPIAEPAGAAAGQFHVDLPQPRLGTFRVRISFIQNGYSNSPLRQALQVMLPEPANARLARRRVVIDSAAELTAALDATHASAWQHVNGAPSERGLVLTTTEVRPVLPLVIGPASSDQPSATTLERAWLQVWQAGGAIQVRAAYRFRTDGKIASVELPPQVSADEIEVLVDGDLARVTSRPAGRLVVELPAKLPTNGSAGRHTLELRYRQVAALGLIANQVVAPPQLIASSALGEAYWQLVLPGDRHLLWAPPQLVLADDWSSATLFSGTPSAATQSELESWVGTANLSAPPSSQNFYLFAGLAPVASIELVSVPRWLVVLTASATVLALAMLWIYVPRVRHGWIGLLAAAIVATLALSFPTQAMLFAQASLIGWVLAIVTWKLRRRYAPPAKQLLSTTGSIHVRLSSSHRGDSRVTPTRVGSASVTPPMSIATSESER